MQEAPPRRFIARFTGKLYEEETQEGFNEEGEGTRGVNGEEFHENNLIGDSMAASLAGWLAGCGFKSINYLLWSRSTGSRWFVGLPPPPPPLPARLAWRK